MQQQIDLILMLTSNCLFVHWMYLAYNNRDKSFGEVNLTKWQVLYVILAEILIFSAMYWNYICHQSPDIADSFSWHYYIAYFRGLGPFVVLAMINDKLFTIKDPVFEAFFMALFVDYIVLLFVSKVSNIKHRSI